MPGGNHQHWHILGIGLGNARKGVLDPRPLLGGEHAVLLASPDAGKAVRHADADPLLPAQDGSYVERGAGLDQRVARIAGQELCPFAPKNLGKDVSAVHAGLPLSVCGP